MDERAGLSGISAEDGEAARQVRIAVSGQTGKAAALFYQYGREERYVSLAPSHPRTMSNEHTVRTPPIAVKRIGSPFLHRVIPFDAAVEKSFGQKLRGLFEFRSYTKEGRCTKLKFRTMPLLCAPFTARGPPSPSYGEGLG